MKVLTGPTARARTYPSTTQLQENVHIIHVLKERVELDNVFVRNTAMNANLLGHLQQDKWNINENLEAIVLISKASNTFNLINRYSTLEQVIKPCLSDAVLQVETLEQFFLQISLWCLHLSIRSILQIHPKRKKK